MKRIKYDQRPACQSITRSLASHLSNTQGVDQGICKHHISQTLFCRQSQTHMILLVDGAAPLDLVIHHLQDDLPRSQQWRETQVSKDMLGVSMCIGINAQQDRLIDGCAMPRQTTWQSRCASKSILVINANARRCHDATPNRLCKTGSMAVAAGSCCPLTTVSQDCQPYLALVRSKPNLYFCG